MQSEHCNEAGIENSTGPTLKRIRSVVKRDKTIMAPLAIRKSVRPGRKVQKSQAQNNYAELPQEAQENILSLLTLPELASSLPCLSKSWQMFAKSSAPESRAFRKVLDEKHPKMIAIVKMEHRFRLTVAAFDFASGQWHRRVLRHLLDNTDEHRMLKSGYVKQACFAHDAGFLCLVLSGPKKVCPIVVCNLLTNEWKALPFRECRDSRTPMLVQLVVDESTGHYQVTVVYKYCRTYSERRRKCNEWCVAELYDSATKLWSRKKDGMVYGQELFDSEQVGRYHNCESGQWFETEKLSLLGSLGPEHTEAYFLAARNGKQRMFKLKQEPGEDTYRISEYEHVTDSTGFTGVRVVDSYTSSLPVMSSGLHDVYLRVTDRFLLLGMVQHLSEEREHRPQTMTVRDQQTGEWHDIPAPPREFKIPFKSKYFMCELRWNAIP